MTRTRFLQALLTLNGEFAHAQDLIHRASWIKENADPESRELIDQGGRDSKVLLDNCLNDLNAAANEVDLCFAEYEQAVTVHQKDITRFVGTMQRVNHVISMVTFTYKELGITSDAIFFDREEVNLQKLQ